MNYIILDLEATCWEGEMDKNKNETIEIGAVLVNEKQEIISSFEQFVKPLKNPKLSDFCTELTSIQQKDIDHAPHFPEAIQAFKQWFQFDTEDYMLCSWGYYDKKQFESDCLLYGIDSSWTDKHISLKHQYAKFKKLKRAIGMKNALLSEGIILEGTHHRGIDDARNIAKIFLKYFDKWNY
ncbi:3'-5' exonuclease [Limibacter armeniacum]|uniref:3'-5' exonuclease n=1 Tax=Limibacter armeniacum TaxID=466084 RepID=UPI002FE4FFE6